MIRVGDRNLEHKRRLYKDIVYLCGPFIQEREGTITFVHFSAKELVCDELPKDHALMCTTYRYLIRKDDGFICTAIAHKVVASTCLTYLCFQCFDEHMDVESFIRLGEYVLQEYACNNWLYHVENTVADAGEMLQEFVELLQQFLKLRSSLVCSRNDNNHIHPSGKLRALESKWPKVYASLRDIFLFTGRNIHSLDNSGDYPRDYPLWRLSDMHRSEGYEPTYTGCSQPSNPGTF